jgi:hypothetical protein
MILYFFIFFIILYFIIKYNYLLFEYFDDDIYNYKYSDIFKNMFTQPTIWLGYQDFDGNEKDRFEKRYQEHKSGRGSQFTSAYKFGTIEKFLKTIGSLPRDSGVGGKIQN